MKSTHLLAFVLILAGCDGPEPDMAMQQRSAAKPVTAPSAEQQRFTVARVGVFRDDLAYGYNRGIYVIVDTKTGQEFVGVSGIGISELGSHSSGKTTAGDER